MADAARLLDQSALLNLSRLVPHPVAFCAAHLPISVRRITKTSPRQNALTHGRAALAQDSHIPDTLEEVRARIADLDAGLEKLEAQIGTLSDRVRTRLVGPPDGSVRLSFGNDRWMEVITVTTGQVLCTLIERTFRNECSRLLSGAQRKRLAFYGQEDSYVHAPGQTGDRPYPAENAGRLIPISQLVRYPGPSSVKLKFVPGELPCVSLSVSSDEHVWQTPAWTLNTWRSALISQKVTDAYRSPACIRPEMVLRQHGHAYGSLYPDQEAALIGLIDSSRTQFLKRQLEGDRPVLSRNPHRWDPLRPLPEQKNTWISAMSGGGSDQLGVLDQIIREGPQAVSRPWAALMAEACELLLTRNTELKPTQIPRLITLHASLCTHHKLNLPALTDPSPLPGPIRVPATRHGVMVLSEGGKISEDRFLQRFHREENPDEIEDALYWLKDSLENQMAMREAGHPWAPPTYADEPCELNLEGGRMLAEALERASKLEEGQTYNVPQGDLQTLMPWTLRPKKGDRPEPAQTPLSGPISRLAVNDRGIRAYIDHGGYPIGLSRSRTRCGDTEEDAPFHELLLHRRQDGVSLEIRTYHALYPEGPYGRSLRTNVRRNENSLNAHYSTAAWPVETWLAALYGQTAQENRTTETSAPH